MTDLATPTSLRPDATATGPAPLPDRADLDAVLDSHRREITGYCYRMLGSAFEADDAVQETFLRAWRAYDRFEGRSSLRSWLYRIATNVCFDLLGTRKRRERPMGLGGPQPAEIEYLGQVLPEETWVEPVPDDRVLPHDGDPAQVALGRESIRLAFVAALQYLPPRQRAVLLLREVLRWQASEVAELLDTTVASVNSALQRARATLAARTHWDSSGLDDGRDADVPDDGGDAPALVTDQALGAEEKILLERYLDAFERYDMDALVAILHADATLSMPPYPLWMRGTADIVSWMTGPGWECEGSRLVPVAVNGTFGFGQYRRADGGGYEAWALQVIETDRGRVTAINAFLDTAAWFPLFGLPTRLDD
ncbi:sigma-70 family RNA polymerase sigma factor [Cellulosimicrobium protaetiae]|uniref:Sigma-70 family RNA polymerase sigma factor n=1 Tax=Cellulosimicrobium protaetiae TaxID=2587808 RepID=A0A6M5UCR8_9MICO|nr:sigma-70 family RNA polymerase sigma factor [Cellulosimicrobium protaetiae]QJW34995.1 sigma-70 family RNA polymerase sigma factor [Cellulosimicrobium protaetiae]